MNTVLATNYYVMPWWALIPTLILCIPIIALLGPQLTNIFLVFFGFKFLCHCVETFKGMDRKQMNVDTVMGNLSEAAKNTVDDVKECGMQIINAVKPYMPIIMDTNSQPNLENGFKDLTDSFLIEIDVPGVKKEDVTITTEKNTLNVCAIRKSGTESEGAEAKEYKHSFDLPETADLDSIVAKCDNGLLTIVIQKKDHSKPEKKNVTVE